MKILNRIFGIFRKKTWTDDMSRHHMIYGRTINGMSQGQTGEESGHGKGDPPLPKKTPFWKKPVFVLGLTVGTIVFAGILLIVHRKAEDSVEKAAGWILSSWSSDGEGMAILPPPKSDATSKASPSASEQGRNSAPAGKHGKGIPIIPTGKILYGRIVNDLNSDYPGPVLAQAVGGKFDGVKFLGSFQRDHGALLIKLDRAIYPDGETDSIGAFAVSPGAKLRSVLEMDVYHHYLYRYGSLLASAFLQGFGQSAMYADSTSYPSAMGMPVIGFNRPDSVKIAANTPVGIMIVSETGQKMSKDSLIHGRFSEQMKMWNPDLYVSNILVSFHGISVFISLLSLFFLGRGLLFNLYFSERRILFSYFFFILGLSFFIGSFLLLPGKGVEPASFWGEPEPYGFPPFMEFVFTLVVAFLGIGKAGLTPTLTALGSLTDPFTTNASIHLRVGISLVYFLSAFITLYFSAKLPRILFNFFSTVFMLYQFCKQKLSAIRLRKAIRN